MAGGEEEELCVNCGKPSRKKSDSIPITLLVSRASKQVVCVEVGKQFVDMLMGFLTIPLSCLVRVLTAGSMIHYPEEKEVVKIPDTVPYSPGPRKPDPHFALGAIANVFDSVAKLDAEKLSVEKSMLLEARPTTKFGAGKLLKTQPSPKEGEEAPAWPDSGLFSCGAACEYSTSIAKTKCPKHKKPMITPIKMVEDQPADPCNKRAAAALELADKEGGYVKPETRFYVTNQLEIVVCSSARPLLALTMIKAERVGDLDTMDVVVNATEVLELLKASLLSTNVLNDVFGKYCVDIKRNMPMGSGSPFFPVCGEKPCCDCERMGVPLHPTGGN